MLSVFNFFDILKNAIKFSTLRIIPIPEIARIIYRFEKIRNCSQKPYEEFSDIFCHDPVKFTLKCEMGRMEYILRNFGKGRLKNNFFFINVQLYQLSKNRSNINTT